MRLVAFVSVLLALAACVPADDTRSTIVRAPTPVAGARPGGTLRIAITPPDGVDPTGVHEAAGALITSTMCDQLVVFDPATGRLAPGLADWTVGDGGRQLFIKIRKDARFADGTPVTAEDVSFTLSRLADDDYASPSASLMEQVGGYAFTHGDEEIDEEVLRRVLAGVSIVNANTVSITVIPPNADFVRTLAHPATSPVSERAALRAPAAFARDPVCAGPYKLVAPYRPGATVVLERTPDYKGVNPTLTRAGRGYADRIEFVVARTRARAARLVRQGKADIAMAPDPTSSTHALTEAPSLQTEFLGLPTTKAPFDDPRVRIALSRALDRNALARTFDTGRAATSAFVPEQIAPTPRSCDANAPPDGNTSSARTLLARTKVDVAKLRPTLTYNDEFGNQALMRAVVKQWRDELGLRVRLQPMAWERFRSLATRPQGLDRMFRFSWSPPAASVEQVVGPLFTVRGIGSDNWSLYSSRDLDDAMREAREAADETDRSRNFARALAILCDDMPMIPLLRANRGYATGDGWGSAIGAFPKGIDGELIVRELTVK